MSWRGLCAGLFLGLVSLGCSSTTQSKGNSGGDAGSAGSAGSAGASGGHAGEAGAGAGGGSSGDGGVDCDGSLTDADAIHVSTEGSDEAGDGSSLLPLASVGRALDVAATTGKELIVVAGGTYREHLQATAAHAGLSVSGGWSATGSQWTQDCSSGARSLTVLASPDAIALDVTEVDVPLELQTLTLATKAQGASADGVDGESLFGVWVHGADSKLSLRWVDVHVGKAGDGLTAPTDTQATPLSCDGLTDCADGADGPNGLEGVTAAETGVFSTLGFTPGAGADGTSGEPGQNGLAGGDGAMDSLCVDVCTGGSGPNCGAILWGPQRGGKGTCGCGGAGGPQGRAGRGGGSAVGILTDGTVSLAAVQLTIGDAGSGSTGGDGAPGYQGQDGAPGVDSSCHLSSCSLVNGNCEATGMLQTLPGGTAGGRGGLGGKGGRGGDGAGGFSLGWVLLGDGSVLADSKTQVDPGAPGQGAGSAPSGTAGESLTQP